MVYLIGFLVAFFASVLFTKLTIRLAFKYGFVDDPKRKHNAILHTKPIPRAGGVPVYLASVLSFLVVLLIFLLIGSQIEYSGDSIKHLIGVFIAGFGIVFLGLLDDKYDLSPKLRLALLFLYAVVVVGFGVGISYITNPLGGVFRLDELVIPFYLFDGWHTIVVFADILAIFWIVSLMNIVNWSSGLDGQNAGISTVALLVLGFASLRYDRLSEPTALIAFIVAGAFAGFLIFSAYPQKIMPGFGGSTFSGFMIAVLSILSGAKLATAMIVLAIPILDAAWVFIRRVLKKKNPMMNDRTHLHHYLLDIGWSKRKIAFFYWLICAVLGIIVLNIESSSKVFIFVMVFLFFTFGSLWLQRLLHSSKQ
jgi:UDP-GlcNAc:undecaprenyl-phosphate GlcNAc-1-phosphate transferase